MPRVRSKRWCFTLNNPTIEEKEFVNSLLGSPPTQDMSSLNLTYLIIGKESSQTGTPHYQGYLETSSRIGLRSLKSSMILLTRAHLEPARGTSKQALEYCKKEGDWAERGNPMRQKGSERRTDLEDIRSILENEKSLEKVADEHFSLFVQYRRGFEAYLSMKSPPRNWETRVIVLWGDTGTGKTRFCHAQSEGRSLWIAGDYQWFDGYTGQECVLLDDYRGEYPIQQFLKLTDRYPMQVPVKGGFTNWCPKKMYITSNTDPSTWYKDVGSRTREAFFRRLNTIHFIDKNIYE